MTFLVLLANFRRHNNFAILLEMGTDLTIFAAKLKN